MQKMPICPNKLWFISQKMLIFVHKMLIFSSYPNISTNVHFCALNDIMYAKDASLFTRNVNLCEQNEIFFSHLSIKRNANFCTPILHFYSLNANLDEKKAILCPHIDICSNANLATMLQRFCYNASKSAFLCAENYICMFKMLISGHKILIFAHTILRYGEQKANSFIQNTTHTKC